MQALIRAADRAAGVAAMLLLVALLSSVTLGIVTRAMGDPVAWTDELARFVMVWLAMAGWILSTRRRGHVRIRFFQNLLPPALGRAVELLIQAGLLVLGVIVVVYGIDLVGRNLDLEATSLPVSMAWIYAPLVPAGVVTALQALAEMWAQFARPALRAGVGEAAE